MGTGNAPFWRVLRQLQNAYCAWIIEICLSNGLPGIARDDGDAIINGTCYFWFATVIDSTYILYWICSNSQY